MNKDQKPHSYSISFSGLEQASLDGDTHVQLAAGEILEVPIRLSIAPENIKRLNSTIYYHIKADNDESITIDIESRFIGPGTP